MWKGKRTEDKDKEVDNRKGWAAESTAWSLYAQILSRPPPKKTL